MKNIKYQCIKEIVSELKKSYKGITSVPYGYCCNTDYFSGILNDSEVDYNNECCPKLYKGGLNNDFKKGTFQISNSVFWGYKLTKFNIKEVCKTMQSVADRYNYKVITPKEEYECIELIFEECEVV